MVLGWDFVFWGSLLVSTLIPLFIYRKRIKEYLTRDSRFEEFLQELRAYLFTQHPKITFDYSIVKKTKNEHNISLRETLIVEDMVSQFVNYPTDIPMVMPNGHFEALGKNYYDYCKPLKGGKVPPDWSMRKELTWQRDDKKCKRCGHTIILMEQVNIYFLRPISKGGEFNFENMMTLCNSCNAVVNSQDLEKTQKNLPMAEKLMSFVE
jgi:DNA-directed RNA polymerase subunit RPC12/RpoP